MKQKTGYTLGSIVLMNRRNFLLGAFLLILTDVFVFSLPQLIKLLIDGLQSRPLASWTPSWLLNLDGVGFVFAIGGLFLFLSFFVSIGRYFWRHFFILTVIPHIHDIRLRFFNHVQRLDRNFFKNHKVGDLISALTTDTQDMRMAVSIGMLMAVDILVYFLAFPFLLWQLDGTLTLMTVPLLISASFLALFLTRNLKEHYDRQQNVTADLSGRAYEISSGIRILKAFRKEKEVLDEFVRASEKLRDASLVVARYESSFVPGLQFALAIAMFISLLYGGFRVYEGTLELSSLVAFQLYLAYLDWPMMAMGWLVQLYRQGEAASQRVTRMGTAKHSFSDVKSESPNPLQVDPPHLFEVKQLNYQHADKASLLFQNLNLKIPAESWIAVTGPVASGKTTLLELLSRQRDPLFGSVTYKNVDLRYLDREVIAQKIVYTPQETFLFSRSIRQNLEMGLATKNSEEDLWSLLRDLKFPLETIESRGGLHTQLGERGVNLSGGQKQRLSLGRALLRKREVYLLDDLFSHLDADTEYALMRVLKKRLGEKVSILLVSQRLETILGCEYVLVLNGGAVEYFGPTVEGIKSSPFLSELSRIQREGAAAL